MSESNWTRRDFLKTLGLGAVALNRPGARAFAGRAQTAEHRSDHVGRHGLFRPRLLRRRYRHAQPERPGGQRPAVQPVLQHRPLLPDAGLAHERPVSAPGEHRTHGRGLGLPLVPGRPEPQLRHHCRGASAGGLPHLHDRQMACDALLGQGRPQAQLAAATRVRAVLRHDPGRRQLLRSRNALPGQHVHHAAERPRVQARVVLLHRCAQRQCRQVPPGAP